MDDRPDDDSDAALADLAGRLHGHLRATAERPVEREASRWLGEAEAVAGDAAEAGAPAVICKRTGQVRDLLANVEATGDATADERIADAREITARILARCD
jgi:hypothetical protein